MDWLKRTYGVSLIINRTGERVETPDVWVDKKKAQEFADLWERVVQGSTAKVYRK